MDWFAIASYGAYPTPTPTTTQRAAYAVSYGLLSILYDVVSGGNKWSSLYPWDNTGKWNDKLGWNS